jgi:hypothetical protein
LVQERPQPFGGGGVEGDGDPMGTRGAFGQRVQSALVEGMDGIAHRLVVAAEGVGNPPGALVPGGSKEDLAATQGKGIGGAQPRRQCVAFAVRQRADEDWCTHT